MRRRTYNPAQLSAEELKASFIARRESLDEMLRILCEQDADRPCQHLLVVGSRGMGKTTLGLRFLQAIREAPYLSEVWQPVRFNEESYQVTSVGEFWLAALRHLSEGTGESRWLDRADELRSEPDAGRRESYALASLLDFCETSGRRVILFVENLDQVFEQIGNDRELHALREALIGHPELLLVGSANAVFDSIVNSKAPFYEFFLRISLHGLDAEACQALVEGVCEREGKPEAAKLLSAERGRMETIRKFTGGNPRLLVIAAEIRLESPLGSAFEHLERLIDEQTPYFKAQIDALPVQARKVFHYLAGEWAPRLARDVAAGANLSVSHTSAQLRQLRDKGYVNEVRLQGEARSRYEVVDRFYNLYYLLRFSQPGRERVARFVKFLQDLYGDRGMASLYEAVLTAISEVEAGPADVDDLLSVIAGAVASDELYPDQDGWFERARRVVIEHRGSDAPVLSELDEKAPTTTIAALLDQAGQFVKDGEFDQAASALKRVHRSERVRSERVLRNGVLAMLGDVQVMAKKPDDALASFEEVVDVAPREVDDGRTVVATSLMSIAKLRLDRGEDVAALRAAEQGCKLLSVTDAEEVRRITLGELRVLAVRLWGAGKGESGGVALWSAASGIVAPEDSEELRLNAVQALLLAGSHLGKELDQGEGAVETLQKLGDFVHVEDGSELREARILGLLVEGDILRSSGRVDEAVAAWKSAVNFVRDGDGAETREGAGLCLLGAAIARSGMPNAEELSENLKLARMAVELSPENPLALQFCGHVLAAVGEWGESIALLGRALAHLDKSDDPDMLSTLLRVAADGHAAEVREFMADTRLTEDYEALWYALELELGGSVGVLPMEMLDAVSEVRETLNALAPAPQLR